MYTLATTRNKTLKVLLNILVIIILIGGQLFAGTTGKIAGHVTDSQTGEPLIGANIIIEGTTTGAAADLNGDYYIINVPPGIYKLRVSMVGYSNQEIEKVRVQVDLTSTINVKLTSADINLNKAVVVTAKRDIQTDLTSSERSVQADQILSLPARDLTSILTLESGITKDASGGIHIRGGRSNEVSYMIDGVQVMNPLNRSNGISIDDQSYEEVKAITGTFNAEYGQALSGVVNIVTKKGSDHFVANASAYTGDFYSNDGLYSYMSNRDWANAAANAFVIVNNPIMYDFSKNGVKSYREAVIDAENGYKPWLTKEKYLNSYDPLKNYDLQLNLSGPVIGTGNHVTYYLAGRYQDGNGSTYGKDYYEPWGLWSPAYDTVHSFKMPDGSTVPLYTYTNMSGQGKIFYNDQNIQLSYGIYYNKNNNYSAYSKYSPDGGSHSYSDTYTQIITGTYLFSNSTFLEVFGNSYYSNYRNRAYDDPYDPRYVPSNTGDWQQYVFNPSTSGSNISVSNPTNDFVYFGNSTYRQQQYTKYNSIKLDLTSQMNKYNLVKLGVSGKQHDISNDYYSLQFSQTDYRPIIPDESSAYHTYYTAKPKEFAAYIQDKIEFNELIINIGLRFDYFDSDGRILADPKDPEIYSPVKMDHIYKNYTATTPTDSLVEYTTAERAQFWYKKADAKYALSPRFGLSFPITQDGVIHFSYGHFFQNPEFQYLYTNPNYWITGAGATNLVGNANLNPEKSVMYEIGLQQKLFNNVFFNVTGFYRDIRDWVSTGNIQETYQGQAYYSYINKDNAVAKGITLSASYNLDNLSINLDYTYMSAMGTNSNPTDAFYSLEAGQQPKVQLVDLSWEQPQSLNLVVTYNVSGWTATLTSSFASGYPYTPSIYSSEATGSSSSYTGYIENSARMPSSLNFDVRLAKEFKIGKTSLVAICSVTNLFDTRNPLSVYSDTGEPLYTKDSDLYSTRILEISDSRENYAGTGNVSAPRYIQFGLQVGL
ncbi:MAG: TonB-dependent receptor [Ignavibacteriaceae bacterium]|nr:TonB-dependent receptor [Ignavibacteriaceae bacterium]